MGRLKRFTSSPYVKVFIRVLRADWNVTLAFLFILLITVAAIAPKLFCSHSPTEVDISARLSPPSGQHLMGTDRYGRDVFARVVYGARISLIVGISSVLVSLAMGIPLGLLTGYFGGWIDALLMRVMDGVMAFPTILLAIILVAISGASLFNLVLALAIVRVPAFARLIRASVLSEKTKTYVEAVKAIGGSRLYIMLRSILPNCLSPIIVYATLSIGYAILNEAALSFLGLGIQPPTPAWGAMLNEGRAFMRQMPWASVFPGICIFLTVWSLNVLGDGLRDALDPRNVRKVLK